MILFLKTVLFAIIVLGGQVAYASPRDDANFIAQRDLGPDRLQFLQSFLKGAFASVYAKPIKELGIKIADQGRFIQLIPDEDIVPYIDKLLVLEADNYLATFNSKQLKFLADTLRQDNEATAQKILSDEYRSKSAAALKAAQARATPSGSTDPQVLALEAFMVELDATSQALSENSEAIGQSLGVAFGRLFGLVHLGHDIQRLEEHPLDNPVTVAAAKADGILRFANPVQRRALLRRLSDPETTGGARFMKPPIKNSVVD